MAAESSDSAVEEIQAEVTIQKHGFFRGYLFNKMEPFTS